MAGLSVQLQNEVMCPIHLDYYTEPMQLRCLHSICKSDVAQLADVHGVVKCPVCKQVSTHRDIRPDFKTQRLIEIHRSHKAQFEGKKLCDLCDLEVALTWCLDCSKYLGERCERAHMRVAATQGHVFQNIDSIIEEKLETIRELAEKLDTVRQACIEHKAAWIRHRCGLEEERNGIKEKIKASDEAFMKGIRRHHDRLRRELRLNTDPAKQNADTAIENLDTEHKQIMELSDYLNDIIDKSNARTLLNGTLLPELMELTKHRCAQFEGLSEKTAVPHIATALQGESQEAIDTALHRLHLYNEKFSVSYKAVMQERNKEWSLALFLKRSLKCEVVYRYMDMSIDVRDIAYIDGQIWSVLGNGAITTVKEHFDGTVTHVRHFYVHDAFRTYRITKVVPFCQNRNIAISEGKLLVINNDGFIMYVLDNHAYHDVCVYAQFVYGLIIKRNLFNSAIVKSHIKIYQFQQQAWQCSRTISLDGEITSLSIHGTKATFSLTTNQTKNDTTMYHYDLVSDLKSVARKSIYPQRCVLGDTCGHVLYSTLCRSGEGGCGLNVLFRDGSDKELKAHDLPVFAEAVHATVNEEGQLLVQSGKVLYRITQVKN